MHDFSDSAVIDSIDILRHHIHEKLSSGTVPKFLGVEGFMALLHDKVIRWFETNDIDEILQLVTDGFIAFHISRPALPPGNDPSVDREYSQEEVDDFVNGGEEIRSEEVSSSSDLPNMS